MSLRQAALEIKNKLPEGSIILSDWPEVDKSHLYVKYWSDYESFEIYHFHPAWDWLNLLKGNKNIFLLSERPLSGYGKPSAYPHSYIYQLR
jgi:hypothetical protein